MLQGLYMYQYKSQKKNPKFSTYPSLINISVYFFQCKALEHVYCNQNYERTWVQGDSRERSTDTEIALKAHCIVHVRSKRIAMRF